MRFSALITACIVGALFIVGPMGEGRAMGGGSDNAQTSKANPDYTAGKAAIDRENWAEAINRLNKAAAADPRNADIQNYLGYAHRKSGDYEKAFVHYKQALSINPKHRGAHEYIGEAYLETGKLAKAQEHLDALDSICTFGCKEYSELRDRIAAFKAKQSS